MRGISPLPHHPAPALGCVWLEEKLSLHKGPESLQATNGKVCGSLKMTGLWQFGLDMPNPLLGILCREETANVGQ